MRRAILTLGSTAAGLAALLSFKTHSTAAAVADPGVLPGRRRRLRRRPARPSPRRPRPRPRPGERGRLAGEGEGERERRHRHRCSSMTTRTITGAVESTMYGPMQVKVTLTGTRITNVAVVQETNDGQESQQIDSFSIPKLTAETLAAQSARIDTVSGATQTSTGYIGSLQSALDQAGA